jgi:hypothetical protein
MSEFANNLEKANRLVTRNRNNIVRVSATSFWINDEKQPDQSNLIEIRQTSTRNWLKVTQTNGHEVNVFPVDGNSGVFREAGLPINNNRPFTYEWQTATGIENKNAGDCDCLLLDEKWRFLEFKTGSFSEELDQINNNRNKAEAQLAKSLTSFREQLSDSTLSCECVLVVPTFFDRPRFKASFSRKIRFLKRFQVDLKEVTFSSSDKYDLTPSV